MPYDKNAKQHAKFTGGPMDGKEFWIVPADRLVYEQKTSDGTVLKRHTYNITEYVDEKSGEVIKLEYVYQP